MTPLWRNRDFTLLWSAGSISAVGTRIGREALPLAAVLVLGAGPLQLSFLTAVQSLPALALGLFAGAWLDRRSRRPVMIMADFARALVLVTIPLAALFGILELWQLYVVALVAATLSFLFDVADQSLLPDIVTRPKLIEANSKRDAATSAAEVVGPPICGMLVQTLTAPVAILVDAVSFVVSGLLLLRMKPEPVRPPAPRMTRHDYVREIREGLWVLWRHDILRPLIVAKSMRALFGGMIGAFYVFYVMKELAINNAALMGFFIGCGGAASLAGAWLAPILARRFPMGPMMIAAQVTTVVGMACLPLAAILPVAWIPAALIAQQLVADSSLTFYVVLERSLRQNLAPPEVLGRINSTWIMLSTAPAPLGALAGGLIAEGIGLGETLWVAVAGYALSLVIVARSGARSLNAF